MINRGKTLKWFNILALVALLFSCVEVSAQLKRSTKSTISGGVMTRPLSDTVVTLKVDSLVVDSLKRMAVDSLGVRSSFADSLAHDIHRGANRGAQGKPAEGEKPQKEKFFRDTMSISRMCWIAAALPGYGQIYNKQMWKLPILYGALGASTVLFAQENKRYQPLKKEYDELTLTNLTRDDYLDDLQRDMIRSNTRRQLYIGAMAASYIYFLGDAAVNYSTNSVSNVKKATTLAMICPGAGQIYNGSYWKIPFVVGGFASMIYVVDWNNRGYQRFKKAYALLYDYEENPDDYPDGSPDEFGGRYSSSYLKSIRNSYRRNRDMSLIMTAGLYILQVIDAHVDAHLRDYDISDDLTMNIEPMIKSSFSPSTMTDCAAYGFNINLTF